MTDKIKAYNKKFIKRAIAIYLAVYIISMFYNWELYYPFEWVTDISTSMESRLWVMIILWCAFLVYIIDLALHKKSNR